MDAMPQLNEAESKFFESRGQDVAPSLSEGAPGPEEAPTDKVDASERGEATVTETPARAERDERFVPLKALQEERAEKKQLREELKAYREWQAQLAQRLQQTPFTQGQQAQQSMPDPQQDPLGYINHVLGNVQNSTAELQQWRKQQEQAAQQRAAVHQYASWATAQEQEFAKSQPEYHDAYRYAAEARDRELKALGYDDPNQRAAIVRTNTAEIIHNAMQQGRNPAELVWEYARARGFTARRERSAMDGGAGRGTRDGSVDGAAKIAAGMQVAGGKLNQGGVAGEGELSARDLAGITDPEEFEKAWKRVFGKKR